MSRHIAIIQPQHDSMCVEIRRTPTHRHWAVTKDDTCVLINGRLYLVPARFAFDGSSIPTIAWMTMATPLEWPWCYAGCIHDAMYRGRMQRRAEGRPRMPVWFAPDAANGIYHDLLRACGVGPFPAWRCWVAVALYSKVWGARHTYLRYQSWIKLYPGGAVWVRDGDG